MICVIYFSDKKVSKTEESKQTLRLKIKAKNGELREKADTTFIPVHLYMKLQYVRDHV